jgi:hypothetical protein
LKKADKSANFVAGDSIIAGHVIIHSVETTTKKLDDQLGDGF